VCAHGRLCRPASRLRVKLKPRASFRSFAILKWDIHSSLAGIAQDRRWSRRRLRDPFGFKLLNGDAPRILRKSIALNRSPKTEVGNPDRRLLNNGAKSWRPPNLRVAFNRSSTVSRMQRPMSLVSNYSSSLSNPPLYAVEDAEQTV